MTGMKTRQQQMTVSEYNRFGKVGRKDNAYTLCEDPRSDNSPRLNKTGFAFAVGPCAECDDTGYYPCSCLYFDLPDIELAVADTGGLGRSVAFNPTTEEFRFGEPVEKKDTVRPIDFDFYLAASRGSVDDLKRLVAQGANPDASVYNDINEDMYAIHQAALNPDINVIKYLVSLGVDPGRIDYCDRQPLFFAVRRNSLEIVRYLVESGNDPCELDIDGDSVLSEAALNPDIRVLDYLMSKGAQVDYAASDSTELCHALTRGTVERMQYFIDHGANLSRAMESSCYSAPLANIRYALEHGYDPNSFTDGVYKDGQREKVIDKLTPKRRALFMEFGGKVYYPNAEIWGEEIPD